MADPQRKRRVLTLCQRLQIIKAVEDNPTRTRTQIAIAFGVPLPTLSNILKGNNKYLEQATSGDVIITTKRAKTFQLGSGYMKINPLYVLTSGYPDIRKWILIFSYIRLSWYIYEKPDVRNTKIVPQALSYIRSLLITYDLYDTHALSDTRSISH